MKWASKKCIYCFRRPLTQNRKPDHPSESPPGIYSIGIWPSVWSEKRIYWRDDEEYLGCLWLPTLRATSFGYRHYERRPVVVFGYRHYERRRLSSLVFGITSDVGCRLWLPTLRVTTSVVVFGYDITSDVRLSSLVTDITSDVRLSTSLVTDITSDALQRPTRKGPLKRFLLPPALQNYNDLQPTNAEE
jgi:hypothetical protein